MREPAIPEIGEPDEWDTESSKSLGHRGEEALAKLKQMLESKLAS